jgi:phosphinothricin acetyltransferase
MSMSTSTSPATASTILRAARPDDLSAINDIYNHYVHTSTCTFAETSQTDAEARAWFDEHDEASHPVLVADRGGSIVGWASLSRFKSRCAYRFTVEDSVYIRHDCQRQGLGRLLLGRLLELAARAGYHSILGIVAADQPASIALHQHFGFREVGRLVQVGYKFNRWIDVVYLQRELTR